MIRPWGLAAVACMGLLAGCSSSGSVTTSAAAVKPTIIAGPAALAAASNPQPDGRMWLLAGPATSRGLFQLSLTAKKVTGSTPVAAGASAVAETLGGQVLVGVGGIGGALELHDPNSGLQTADIPLSGGVLSIATSADGQTAYVLQQVAAARSVAVVNLTQQAISGSIPVAGDTVGIGVLPQGELLALSGSGQLSELQADGGKVVSHFGTGSGTAFGLAISPDGMHAYVGRRDGSVENVAVVDLTTQSVTHALPASADAVGLAISADGHQLYVAVGAPTLGNVQSMAV